MKLSCEIPVESAVYQWIRRGASAFAGCMAGWSMTIFAISLCASLGFTLACPVAFGVNIRV